QLRTKVTNSIGKVKEDVLQKGLFSNPAQALSGAVSGVRVLQTSGDPGATPTIILRGGTDYNGTGSPLVLVDGQVRGSLSDINPEDIESMEVLKDAGATAIYGARANNGVILVTTKRGKEGKGEVSVKAKVGINYYNNPYEFMNAGD
ncbi:TonB-dependent receptor plug domain-containing protein, partial [Bacteroides fragilis]